MQFLQNVANAEEVFLRSLQFALGLLLAGAELHDARRLLKGLAARPRLCREQFIDLSLSDDGISLPADAGVAYDVQNVLEPHRRAV